MNKKTIQISDLMPDDSDFSLEGQFSLNGQFSIDCTHASRVGDLFRTGFEMTSDFGHGNISILGKQHYTAVWETYLFKQGMISSAQLSQPFVGLCFQLEGLAQSIELAIDFQMDMRPGEANLVIIPPMNETFELKEEYRGSSFVIMLSRGYLEDLSRRFPYLLEPILTKVNQGELCLLREQNLTITPRMRGVIQRIRNYDDGHITGSLFLEAQILDLLSLFFTQQEQLVSADGHSLPRSDQERIRAAREILTERLENPPTLAELSRLVGTNEFKLKRGFKEIFGTSPYAYHLQHKLELARSYVLDTDLTIAEIAYQVGYSDPAHLTNAFRKQYGFPPSDLR